ncbi:hypothetical protein [Flavobacterium sangjuense]|uniref:Lipocalin-like domain-containing protein n=1 Tax=Flavobacterium sangjuense TaxID=2518177 RepID=A0A4P7PTN5_9FLAO|nr:hypothetical protein [Flavobacterium sangjuense]QBZ98239.1 hypothetical protein GS03_01744 [Flavobacterium sangjuense]
MNKIVLALFLFASLNVFSQKPCEIDTNVTDSLGTYKSTKQFIVFERSFAGNSTNVFFNLTSNNGILGLEAQILRRSSGFIKANCFDANSRIYLQLNNGKIVTLIYVGNDSCGTLIQNENSPNSRILIGSFVFSKENYEELKVSPVTYIRIKFAGETIDYPFKTEFTAELDKKTYQPESYFINYLKCVEN